jgi:tRNA-dihydrouridine synthase 1
MESETTPTSAILPCRPGTYDLYDRIGRPKLVVAPMVDQSDLAFRMMTRKYGAQLVYTQMFNANSFLESREYREMNFTTCPADRPLFVQFAGHDAKQMLSAAKMVEHCCDAVDINLGCPQAIAKRGRYGAYLMEELVLLEDIVRTLSTNLKVPVTCKTRIYKNDFERSVRLCETLVNAGASLLTIHGRTRDEKGHKVADVDWQMIKRLKDHFRGRVPVIANGGIECYEDVQRCLDATGCDGVMSSEAILESPTLFALPENVLHLSHLDMTDEYLQFCIRYPVWPFKSVRSHVYKYLHRYLCLFTNLREAAATSQTIEELQSICQVRGSLFNRSLIR